MPAASFQPLIPDTTALAPLLARAAALISESHRLESPAEWLGGALRPLLRSMNSYYTNKIEGQHTRPADIERALRHQFDADKKQARRQRLALAHIEAEAELESALPPSRAALYDPDFVCHIHAELYRRLPAPERVTEDGAKITPGALREGQVTAGQPLAPAAREVPALLHVWQERYAELPCLEQALVGAETSVIKVDALEALHYVAVFGPLERARFLAMTGLPERTARRVLASLLHFGVLKAETPRAPVAFAVPLASLRFLFPRLWPEAEADSE